MGARRCGEGWGKGGKVDGVGGKVDGVGGKQNDQQSIVSRGTCVTRPNSDSTRLTRLALAPEMSEGSRSSFESLPSFHIVKKHP
jgi:hypothetical protein